MNIFTFLIILAGTGQISMPGSSVVLDEAQGRDGWRLRNDQSLTYIIQASPETAKAMAAGQEMKLNVPEYVQPFVSEVIVRIGVGPVERNPPIEVLQEQARQAANGPASMTLNNRGTGGFATIDREVSASDPLRTASQNSFALPNQSNGGNPALAPNPYRETGLPAIPTVSASQLPYNNPALGNNNLPNSSNANLSPNNPAYRTAAPSNPALGGTNYNNGSNASSFPPSTSTYPNTSQQPPNPYVNSNYNTSSLTNGNRNVDPPSYNSNVRGDGFQNDANNPYAITSNNETYQRYGNGNGAYPANGGNFGGSTLTSTSPFRNDSAVTPQPQYGNYQPSTYNDPGRLSNREYSTTDNRYLESSRNREEYQPSSYSSSRLADNSTRNLGASDSELRRLADERRRLDDTLYDDREVASKLEKQREAFNAELTKQLREKDELFKKESASKNFIFQFLFLLSLVLNCYLAVLMQKLFQRYRNLQANARNTISLAT